jgi:hypothetical protein
MGIVVDHHLPHGRSRTRSGVIAARGASVDDTRADVRDPTMDDAVRGASR